MHTEDGRVLDRCFKSGMASCHVSLEDARAVFLKTGYRKVTPLAGRVVRVLFLWFSSLCLLLLYLDADWPCLSSEHLVPVSIPPPLLLHSLQFFCRSPNCAFHVGFLFLFRWLIRRCAIRECSAGSG